MKKIFIQTIPNKEFLQELKARVDQKKLSGEEVFTILENPPKPEIITKYQKVDYSKLTKADWKKACENLEKDKNYQEEVNL
jgi:hypothetical protein